MIHILIHCVYPKPKKSETVSPKHYGQVSFDKEGYQGELLYSFTTNPPDINIVINTGKQISS